MSQGLFITATKGNNNGLALLHQRKIFEVGGYWSREATGHLTTRGLFNTMIYLFVKIKLMMVDGHKLMYSFLAPL